MSKENVNFYSETQLWSGEKVKKNHPAIKCLYELDTFDSALRLSYDLISDQKDVLKALKKIQTRLSNLKGEVSTHPRHWSDFYKKSKPITSKDVDFLDSCCEKIKKHFGEDDVKVNITDQSKSSVYFDHLVNLCKKCEVMLYDLDDNISDANISIHIKRYLSKLIDYLYLIARYL